MFALTFQEGVWGKKSLTTSEMGHTFHRLGSTMCVDMLNLNHFWRPFGEMANGWWLLAMKLLSTTKWAKGHIIISYNGSKQNK